MKPFVIVLALAVLACAMARDGRADDGRSVTYRSTAPELPLTFDLPEGWRVSEEAGKIDRYREIIVMGPRNAEDTFSASISVRSEPKKAKGGRFSTLEELVSSHEKHLFGNPKVLAKQATKVSGAKAVDFLATYTIPAMRLKGLKPKPIPVKARTVFLEKGGRFYRLSYKADEREFSSHEVRFRRLVETFQFT